MRITFFGAAGEVTGSSALVETNDQKVLVDCGMFQGGEGSEEKNRAELPFSAASLTAVVVTHAHLDHVGRLPLLAKNGFKGFVYATPPTRDLARLIMEDAYGVMAYDHRKFGRPMLYEMKDIEKIMAQFKSVDYYEPLKISSRRSFLGKVKKVVKGKKAAAPDSDLTITFHDAGHVFGSSFILFEADGKKLVFSGDVGNENVPILRDTDALPKDLDMLVCESTYGDRTHEPSNTREAMLQSAVKKIVAEDGVLMIPSFALERTQELLYLLNEMIEREGTLKQIPIFLDSPLAIDALKVFEKYPQYYDEEADKYFRSGDDIFNFPGLVKTYTRDESMKINHTPNPKIIIAGAGMMNGGRILHHAIRYLSDHRNMLMVIGYQSPGTLGWRIISGHNHVQVLGESIPVSCEVKMLNAFSAHGDRDKLIKWIGNNGHQPKKVLLNHGDVDSSKALRDYLQNGGFSCDLAEPQKIFEV